MSLQAGRRKAWLQSCSVTRINGWLVKYEEKEVEELLLENFAEHFQKISEDDLSIGFLYMKV